MPIWPTSQLVDWVLLGLTCQLVTFGCFLDSIWRCELNDFAHTRFMMAGQSYGMLETGEESSKILTVTESGIFLDSLTFPCSY